MAPQTSAGVVVGNDVTSAAKPLNESGATPPESRFAAHQESPHHVTVEFAVADETVASPSTNAPRLGKANTITGALLEEGR